MLYRRFFFCRLWFLAAIPFNAPAADDCHSRLQRIEAIKSFLQETELDPRSETYREIAHLVRTHDIGVFRSPDEFLHLVSADELRIIAGDSELSDDFWRRLVDRSSGFRNSLIDRIEEMSSPDSPLKIDVYPNGLD